MTHSRLNAMWILVAVGGGCGDNIKPMQPVTVSARVSGLTESGLGAGLVPRLNGSETAAIHDSGWFQFRQKLTPGSEYSLAIVKQPTKPSQVCAIDNPTGVVGDEPMHIGITCERMAFAVGGTSSGVLGTGLAITNNGGDPMTLGANGSFTFAKPVDSGKTFDVAIASQPTGPSQTCSVSGGHGVIGDAAVTSVVIDCATDRFTVGGNVEGLDGTVVIRNTLDGSIASLTANGGFAMPSTVASGEPYTLEVLTQPADPSQTCSITHGSGTVTDADVSNVDIVCETSSFAVAGAVSGLLGSGLVLQLNGGANLSVSADGTFEMPSSVTSGMPYDVTVLGQPAGPTQKCFVSNGSGTMAGAAVTEVAVTCKTTHFNISPTVTGLVGQGLVLQNNGGDDLPVFADGEVTFSQSVASGQDFAVSIASQPSMPSQSCVVVSGTGTVGATDVATIAVNCTTNRYVVGGTITGLAGVVRLQNNGGDDLEVGTDGTFAFSDTVASGQPYSVTVLTQPGTPSQTCAIDSGSGTVGGSDVASVSITCVTNSFSLAGTVTGLAGSGLTLKNGADTMPIASDGTFTFLGAVESGKAYEVTVATQPSQPSQTCSVDRGADVMGGAHVTNIAVTCTTNRYKVGGTISGLNGSLMLVDNAASGDALVVSSNGSFELGHDVASADPYDVIVQQRPAGQTCSVTNGTGLVAAAAVTNIEVSCVDDAPPCGSLGLSCCSTGCYDGSECGTTNVCEPYSPPPMCGMLGWSCCEGACIDGSVCGTTNMCEPFSPPPTCGGLGEDCCGTLCYSGLTCNYGMCETACGYEGQACCGDDLCYDGSGCQDGRCGSFIPG